MKACWHEILLLKLISGNVEHALTDYLLVAESYSIADHMKSEGLQDYHSLEGEINTL